MNQKSRRTQNRADILTFVCIISFAILVFLVANQPSGMEALYLIIPVLIVGILHLSLGFSAIVAAIQTGNAKRNALVYGYFGGLTLFLIISTGLSGAMYQGVRGTLERWQNPHVVALYRAITENDLDEVDDALSQGADPSFCFAWQRAFEYDSPLQFALAQNHSDIALLLIEAGTDANLSCGSDESGRGQLPVTIAAKNLDQRSIDALVAAGADVNIPVQSISLLGVAMAGGNYSLPYNGLEAARHRDRRDVERIRSVLELLIQAGADVNSPGAKWSPIHWALVLGDVDILRMLLEAGADPNQVEQQHDRAPLTIALTFDQVELAKLLLTHSPPADISGVRGHSALHAAAKQQSQDGVQLLLDAGLDLRTLQTQIEGTRSGRPPDLSNDLFEALENEDDLLLNALLNAGADLNLPNHRELGRSLAGLVAHDSALLDKFISLGGDVNARNAAGNTSLHYFASCSRCANPITPMTNLILAGADINAPDYRGKTPLDRAQVQHQNDTTQLLRTHGAKRSDEVDQP